MTRRPARAFLGIAIVLFAAGACRDGDDAAPDASPTPADAATTDGEGRAALDRIVHAESTLAYHGLRTVSRGPEGASRETRLEVAHLADGRTWMEWSPDEGAPRRRWTTGRRLAWLARPELLAQNYRVVLDPAPAPPVAWRETRRVLVEPRRAGRPSLELLVDAETWLVLAETGRDVAGATCVRSRFETLAYGSPAHAPEAGAGEGPEDLDAVAAERPTADETLPALEVTALPEGFVSLGARRSSCGARVRDFGDGLAAFSVTEKPASGTAPTEEVRRSRCLGGLSLSRRVDGVDATVSGNLAEADLLWVVRGLRAASPQR